VIKATRLVKDALVLPFILTLVGCLSAPEFPLPDGGISGVADVTLEGESDAVYNPELDCVAWCGECYPVCDSNNPCSGHCLIANDGETYFCSPTLPNQKGAP